MDGCGDIRVFFKMVLPLSAPILAVLVLFYGVNFWNSYFNGLIYLSERSAYPLQMFLREILLNNMADSMIDTAGMDISIFTIRTSRTKRASSWPAIWATAETSSIPARFWTSC